MTVAKKLCGLCNAVSVLPVIGPLLKPKPRVSLIRLTGVIADKDPGRGGISHHKCEKMIENAFDVFDLKAVALIINSPGGSPAQTSLVSNQIRRLAEEKDVPVYAFVEDVAASGGYWLACCADEIYAQETSIVGSIGVISSSFGFQDFIERYGIERRVQSSGKDKSFMDPFLKVSEQDKKRLDGIQKEIHESFISWVKERRGKKLKGTKAKLFEGAFWTAKNAQELGLIDGMAEAKSFMKDKFGSDIKFEPFSTEKKILSSLIGGGAQLRISQDMIETAEEKAVWSRYGF